MRPDADAVVVGAGPAGAATAIRLAMHGWSVVLVERQAYPRQKVCGECISAAGAAQLADLGVAAAEIAGPRHERIAWFVGEATVHAGFPPLRDRAGALHRGYALGRDRLDAMLVARAREVGVAVLQPATVRAVAGPPGAHEVEIERPGVERRLRLETRVVIDAHGSWELGPDCDGVPEARPLARDGDLFGFKAVFRDAPLEPGCLPVLAYPGGYGGLVLGDDGRTTFAGCLARAALRAARRQRPGLAAGEAFAAHVLAHCGGARAALAGARREGAWLAVGPLRPGSRVDAPGPAFRVGNAAGESHPIIGEGIAMALRSARLLATRLAARPPHTLDAAAAHAVRRAYAADWRPAFRRRANVGAACARLAMRPALAQPVTALLARWPGLLTGTARLAGKASP